MAGCLGQVAKKPLDFFDKDLPQLIDFERFLSDHRIPRNREALQANFAAKTSFPQNFRSPPPIPAENLPTGAEVA
jgi:hypothetical protein